MKLNRIFNGKMDFDSGDRFVQKGDYRLLENGIIDQDGSGNRFVVKNLKSTTEVCDLDITGYICIGAEIYKDNIYAFYTNGTLTKFYKIPLSSFTPVELFSKDLSHTTSSKVRDIDFVEDLENNYLLCYFNDTVNQPFKVNITRLEADSSYYTNISDMYVIKAPPSTPSILPYYDKNTLSSRLKTNTFVFAASYEYEDGEPSVMSSFSEIALESLGRITGSNVQGDPINAINAVDITIDSGSKHVSKIILYAIDKKTDTAYIIDSANKDTLSISDNTDYTYTFYNDEVYSVVPDEYFNNIYDNVPYSAGSQSVISNRLLYANYVDGNDLGGLVEDITITEENSSIVDSATISDSDASNTQHSYDFSSHLPVRAGSYIAVDLSNTVGAFNFEYTVSNTHYTVEDLAEEIDDYLAIIIPTSRVVFCTFSGDNLVFNITGGNTFDTAQPDLTYVGILNGLTLKSGELYKYTMLYKDEFGRHFPLTYPVTYNVTSAYDRTLATDVIAKAKLTIGHQAPVGAATYQILRTKNNYTYEYFQAEGVATSGGYIYIKISDDFAEKITSDYTTIELYGDLSGLARVKVEAEIYDIEIGTTHGSTGNWVVIEDTGIPGYSVADDSDFTGSFFYAYRPVSNNSDVYYAVSDEYEISSRNHQGDVNQSYPTTDCEITLDDGDVILSSFFYSGTHLVFREAYKLSGDYYLNTERRGVVYSDTFKQLTRGSSIIWSDTYVDDIDYNGLSTFNLATANYVDLKKEYGTITGLHEHIGRLLVLQEDKFGTMEVNRSVTSTADGAQQINIVDDFLNAASYNAYAGDWGSISDWAFVAFGNTKYALDKKRQTVIRLSSDGITDISRYFMEAYFKGISSDNDKYDYIGAYNSDNNEYWLYSADESKIAVYDEKANAWTRFITGLSIDAIKHYKGVVYSFEDDKIYTHMTGATYGNIHGSQKTFKFKYVENQESAYPKVHNSIQLESNRALDVSISNNDIESDISASDFENREGEYFAYVPNSGGATLEDDDLETGMIKPLGEVLSNTTTTLTLKNTPPIGLRTSSEHTVGDDVYVYDSSGDTYIEIGSITSVSGSVLTISYNSTPTVNFYENKFVFAVENSYINARNIRGNTVNIEITDNGVSALKIDAVSIDVTVSKND